MTSWQDHTIAAIVPAAGSGSRMGAARPKQLLALEGEVLLLRTLRALLAVREIGLCVVAVPAGHREEIEHVCRQGLTAEDQPRIMLVNGGASRQESVCAALAAVPREADLLVVHDGARPLLSAGLIRRCLAAAARYGAAIAAIEVRDTLKAADEQGRILQTVERNGLWQAQTPQVIRRDLLERASALAESSGFVGTDEASLLEHAGIPVHLVAGEEENLKITRPGDLALAGKLLTRNQGPPMRIGHGYDAHRLVEGRELILGGVRIPHSVGLLGHSDADVLCHALMDALLGAVALGDIGLHFPDSDPSYCGISSMLLLAMVTERIRVKGWRPAHVDCTIICQRPKLRPYMDAMRQALAEVLGLPPDHCNVKATTTEQLGFAGREEGIAAHCVASLIPLETAVHD